MSFVEVQYTSKKKVTLSLQLLTTAHEQQLCGFTLRVSRKNRLRLLIFMAWSRGLQTLQASRLFNRSGRGQV